MKESFVEPGNTLKDGREMGAQTSRFSSRILHVDVKEIFKKKLKRVVGKKLAQNPIN